MSNKRFHRRLISTLKQTSGSFSIGHWLKSRFLRKNGRETREQAQRVALVVPQGHKSHKSRSLFLLFITTDQVPLKLKKRRKNSAPFMNSELRRAINFKKALRRKCLKSKTDKNWNKFVKQRNLVTKLKRQSILLKDALVGRNQMTSGQPSVLF